MRRGRGLDRGRGHRPRIAGAGATAERGAAERHPLVLPLRLLVELLRRAARRQGSARLPAAKHGQAVACLRQRGESGHAAARRSRSPPPPPPPKQPRPPPRCATTARRRRRCVAAAPRRLRQSSRAGRPPRRRLSRKRKKPKSSRRRHRRPRPPRRAVIAAAKQPSAIKFTCRRDFSGIAAACRRAAGSHRLPAAQRRALTPDCKTSLPTSAMRCRPPACRLRRRRRAQRADRDDRGDRAGVPARLALHCRGTGIGDGQKIAVYWRAVRTAPLCKPR